MFRCSLCDREAYRETQRGKRMNARPQWKLTGVIAQDDVVEAAGHTHAGFASRAAMNVERRQLCN
jgi:hypothetical protein